MFSPPSALGLLADDRPPRHVQLEGSLYLLGYSGSGTLSQTWLFSKWMEIVSDSNYIGNASTDRVWYE